MALPVYNLFIELDLPTTGASKADFDAALETKRREWNKQTQSARKGAEARSKLALIRDFVAIWDDAEQRKLVAAQADQLRKDGLEAATKIINDAIRNLQSHGFYTEADVKKIVDRVKPTFSIAEVQDRLIAAGVKAESTSPPPTKLPDAFSGAEMERHAKKLAPLGLETYYDVFELKKTTSSQAILSKADQLFDSLMHRSDTESTQRREVASEIRIIFSDEARRRKYDAALDLEVLRPVRDQIDFAARDGVLSADGYVRLLDECRTLGADTKTAEAFIHQVGRERKITIRTSAASTPLDLINCPACNALAELDGSTDCQICGAALYVTCPSCSNSTPIAERLCRHCGFTTGDAPIVDDILRRARGFIDDRKFKAAEAALKEGKAFSSDWPEISKVASEVEAAQKPYIALQDHQYTLEKERRFQALSESWRKSGLSESPDYRDLSRADDRAKTVLEEANKIVAEAAQFSRQGKADDAIDAYQRALSLCVDFAPAQAGLKNTPPAPVSDLEAQIKPGKVSLNWATPGNRRAVEFMVIRKEGAAPRDKLDGDVVENGTTNLWFDDLEAPSGKTIHYGIVTVRDQVESRSIVVTPPLLVPSEPDNVRAAPGDGAVTVSWDMPHGAKAVSVLRVDTEDAAAVPQEVLRGIYTEFSDGNLENGKTYRYDVKALFQNPGNLSDTIESATISVSAAPEKPAEPVQDLNFSVTGGKLKFEWTPASVPVAIYSAPRSLKLPGGGEVMSLKDLKQFGLKRVGAPTASGRLTIDIPPFGRHRYIPVSLAANVGTIGDPVEYDRLEAVNTLSLHRDGADVQARWIWPDGCRKAVVIWGDRAASDATDTLKGHGRTVGNATDKGGEYTFQPNMEGAVTVTVFAEFDGAYAEPVSANVWTGGEVVLSYQVKVTRKYGIFGDISNVAIAIEAEDDAVTPPLVAVVKRGMMPANEDDGSVEFEIPPARITARKKYVFPIEDKHISNKHFLRLAVKNGVSAQGILLQQPHGNKVRMG